MRSYWEPVFLVPNTHTHTHNTTHTHTPHTLISLTHHTHTHHTHTHTHTPHHTTHTLSLSHTPHTLSHTHHTHHERAHTSTFHLHSVYLSISITTSLQASSTQRTNCCDAILNKIRPKTKFISRVQTLEKLALLYTSAPVTDPRLCISALFRCKPLMQ